MAYIYNPSYNLAGHGMGGVFYGNGFIVGDFALNRRRSNFFPGFGGYNSFYNQWPLYASSVSPFYATPQTRYGSCDFAGNQLYHNSCNTWQGGYRPLKVFGKGCVCINKEGDWGCFNRPRSYCV